MSRYGSLVSVKCLLFLRPNFLHFRGLLKFRFMQACRGDWTDPGVTVLAKDSFAQAGDMVDSLGQKPQHFQIPSMADLLVMYSTYEGNSLFV